MLVLGKTKSDKFESLNLGHPPTFMIVDDSVCAADILARMIRAYGGDILYTAKTGADAINMYEMYREKQPDVILMDMELPVMNGAEAMSKILALNQMQMVIAVSDKSTKAYIEAAIAAGARHFLRRPFKMGDAYRVINACLVFQKKVLRMASGENQLLG